MESEEIVWPARTNPEGFGYFGLLWNDCTSCQWFMRLPHCPDLQTLSHAYEMVANHLNIAHDGRGPKET